MFEKCRRCLYAGAVPCLLQKAHRRLFLSTQGPAGRSYSPSKIYSNKNFSTLHIPVQHKKVILEEFYSDFKDLSWFLALHTTAC